MKKIFVLILSVFFYSTLMSQILMNKSRMFYLPLEYELLDTMKIEYFHAIPHDRFLSKKLTCQVDYGQKRALLFYRLFKVRNPDKSKMIFNSEAEIINYFAKNGWEYIEYDTWAFIFRRKKE